MKKPVFHSLVFLLFTFSTQAQNTSSSKQFSIERGAVIETEAMILGFDPQISNRVLPKPHPGTDKETIRNVQQSLEHFRKNKTSQEQRLSAVTDPPILYRNFIANSFNGFVPNDNDMAVSDFDQVCSVTNTSIWSRDLANNLTFGTFSLHSITGVLGLQQEEFDPKVIYDPVSKRFIMLCLNGFTDTTSNILVAFSQDSTSHNNWNVYSLPGNPLNNNLWTDFPMIAVTNDEVFITVNLLYNDSTWQAGFNQTVIWQINKNEGYTGTTLNPLLHFDIEHNNEPIRNLCPVKGGSTIYGPNQYFVSDRNFTAQNDTIFLVEVSGIINTPPPTVTVNALVSNTGYRMPINALQPSVDSLIVNDARILGAFMENNNIQFVLSTLDTVSGQGCIYHGNIDISGTPVATGSLYVNDTLDIAYPNIAWAGTGPGDNTSVISLLYSSDVIFPGCAAFKYDGITTFSDMTTVKTGLSYTNMLTGNERWGDYTGCQTRYNMPGWVWMSGSYTQVNHTTRTWIGELVVSSGVSVPEPPQVVENLKVYPIPSRERINMDFELNSDQWVEFTVRDIQSKNSLPIYRGQLVRGPNNISIQVSSLPAGVFMLEMRDKSGQLLQSRKFVLQ